MYFISIAIIYLTVLCHVTGLSQVDCGLTLVYSMWNIRWVNGQGLIVSKALFFSQTHALIITWVIQ